MCFTKTSQGHILSINVHKFCAIIILNSSHQSIYVFTCNSHFFIFVLKNLKIFYSSTIMLWNQDQIRNIKGARFIVKEKNIWLKIQKYTGMLSNSDSFLFIHFLEISLLRRGCNIIRIKKKRKIRGSYIHKKNNSLLLGWAIWPINLLFDLFLFNFCFCFKVQVMNEILLKMSFRMEIKP